MSRFWSPVVETLTPYIPGEQPKMNRLVKLNTNESPYGPLPKALAAIKAQTNHDLRLYPDPEGADLKKRHCQITWPSFKSSVFGKWL